MAKNRHSTNSQVQARTNKTATGGGEGNNGN